MKLVNLTPHEVVVHTIGREIRIPPTGSVARVITDQHYAFYIGQIPVVTTYFKKVIVALRSGRNIDFYKLFPVCYNCTKMPECPYRDTYITGCPNQRPKRYYLVSTMAAMALRWRKDIVAPDRSPSGTVKDDDGKVIGVRRFQRWLP